MNTLHEELILSVIDNARKTNKDKWYTGSLYDGRIKFKGYGTWLQIFTIDGINHSNCMDCSVKQFKTDILNAVRYANNN